MMGRSRLQDGFLLLEIMVSMVIFTTVVSAYAWYQWHTLACYSAYKKGAKNLHMVCNVAENTMVGCPDVYKDKVIFKNLPTPQLTGFLAPCTAISPPVLQVISVKDDPAVAILYRDNFL